MARVALLLMDGFDDEEVRGLRSGLETDRHEVVLVGPKHGQTVTGHNGGEYVVERDPLQLDMNAVHAIVVPGGEAADKLVDDSQMVNLVYSTAHKGHIVVLVGRGVRMLPPVGKQKSPNPIETGTRILDSDLVKGRVVTGDPQVREELEKAGATWRDVPVMADGNVVTARSAGARDLERLLEELAPLLVLAERPVVSRIQAPTGGWR